MTTQEQRLHFYAAFVFTKILKLFIFIYGKISKKAPKKRAAKYEEKVAIKGSFEDVIGVSVNGSNMKYKIGTKVKFGDGTKSFEIIATKESNPKGVLFNAGFDYVLKEVDGERFVNAFEDDIYF